MITIERLNIAYRDTGQEALRNVSFSVEQGERVAIVGPSGCGKTTLLHAIAGSLADKGVVQTGSIIRNREMRIGMVFQKPTLLPWRTVGKNIAYGIEASGGQLEHTTGQELVRMMGLQGFERYYPAHLSLGMQQRVNFARALAMRPDLLLMDEPLTGLDVATKKDIQEEFKRVLESTRMTTIFVTHSMSEANALADRIVILSARPGEVRSIVMNKGEQVKGMEYHYWDGDEE